jgi:Raf kinase inhibitor-like YbhB/YbcL family protein
VRRVGALVTLAVLLAGCGGDDAGREDAPAVPGFQLLGGGVSPGRMIAPRFTCDGEDVPPALSWRGVPEETRELALVLDDPDADHFTHWLVWGVPAEATTLPSEAREGESDFGEVGYRGPCPPAGETHRYVFRLLALHTDLDLEPGADRDAFDDAVSGHVIAEASFEASYARQ